MVVLWHTNMCRTITGTDCDCPFWPPVSQRPWRSTAQAWQSQCKDLNQSLSQCSNSLSLNPFFFSELLLYKRQSSTKYKLYRQSEILASVRSPPKTTTAFNELRSIFCCMRFKWQNANIYIQVNHLASLDHQWRKTDTFRLIFS